MTVMLHAEIGYKKSALKLNVYFVCFWIIIPLNVDNCNFFKICGLFAMILLMRSRVSKRLMRQGHA